jgi:hypothetical protein
VKSAGGLADGLLHARLMRVFQVSAPLLIASSCFGQYLSAGVKGGIRTTDDITSETGLHPRRIRTTHV